jgi:hypothetical protein
MAQPSGQLALASGNSSEYFWYAQGTGIWDAKNEAMLTKTGSAGMSTEGGANVALGNSSTTYALPALVDIASPWTLIVRCRVGASAGTQAMVCGDATGTANYVWLRQDSSAVICKINGIGAGKTSATTALSTWAFVFSGGVLTTYKDGTSLGTETITAANLKINTLLGGYSGGSFKLNGAFECANVIPSALDATEVEARTADLYAVLDAGGGAAVTITANLGTATATGFAAAIAVSVTIACSLGGATASGHQTTISTGSNVTINASLGTATASGHTASVVSSGSATITTDVFKNNTGTVLASTSIPKLAAIKLSDMTLAASWTNQTTNGSGVLSLTGAMVAATDYLLVVSSTDGAAVGVRKYTAA